MNTVHALMAQFSKLVNVSKYIHSNEVMHLDVKTDNKA